MIGLIMGPQGCGKGTQAALIAKEFDIVHVSTGDLFRAEREKDTDRGRMVKETIDAGNLVPDEITNYMVLDAINENPNILLDGSPRTMFQAEFITKNKKIDFAIVIEIDEDETVKRLGKRRVCTATNKILISDLITQKDIDECEAAGGEIITRDDDKPDAIKHRLQIYHEKTEPVLGFLLEKGVKIIRINGAQSIENVFEDIKMSLKDYF